MSNALARTISTVAIWVAVAVSLTAGVFQRNWTGDTSLLILLMVVVAIAGSGAAATAAVWRGHGAGDPAVGQRTDAEPGAVADGGGM